MASALAILVGCMVVVGWTLDVGVLQRVLPGLVAMNPVTAVSFVPELSLENNVSLTTGSLGFRQL